MGSKAASKVGSGMINGGSLSEKMKKIKMFSAIQKKIKLTCSCKEAF